MVLFLIFKSFLFIWKRKFWAVWSRRSGLSQVGKVWSLFSWRLSFCFQECSAYFTIITFLLFQPELWGRGEQESFFAFYHDMLVKLLEVKPMKVKLSLWEVKPTNVWGTASPRSFSPSHWSMLRLHQVVKITI